VARQNTRRRTTRKPRKTRRKKRWLWIPKLVLLAACVGLALIIVGILVMEKELRRTGIFETEASSAPAGTSAQATPVAGNDREQPVDEVTPAERRELEALLK